MTREEQRQSIIDACIAVQQHTADIAKEEMDSCQQQSNDYGANVDRYDPYRTKMMSQRDIYAKQYCNAIDTIRILNAIKQKPPFERADHGAIVITNTSRIFLSIGLGTFTVGDQEYIAISTQTPTYLAIKGKQVGDTITINDMTQTIKEIL